MAQLGTADRWGGAARGAMDRTTQLYPGQSGQHAGATYGNVSTPFKDSTMEKMMKDDRFFPFFGYGNKLVPPANYMSQDEENFVLPDAYVGSNNYLRTIIISQLSEQQRWGTTLALPWKKSDGMEIAWDEWRFHETSLTRTPEEAVSRLLSSNFQSNRAHTVRYGIALILEHGFWKTQKGQQNYAFNLLQIRNAIATTAQHGVTLALLNPPVYVDSEERYQLRGDRDADMIRKWFQSELDEFACFNKTEDGWQIRVGILDERLIARNETTGDMILVPSKSKIYINNRPENKYSFLSGRERRFDTSALSAGDKRIVVESVMHSVGNHEQSIDPCFREQTIGGFFQMNDHELKEVPLEKFRTGMLGTYIYSETKDDMFKINYATAAQATGLYQNWQTTPSPSKVGDMPISPELGVPLFANAETWGDIYATAEKLDDFVKQMGLKPASVHRDFARKFIIEPSEPQEEKDQPMQDEQEQDAVESNFGDSLVSLENPHGHAERLRRLFKWLKTLDNETDSKTNLHGEVAKAVSKVNTGNVDKKDLAAVRYYAAWDALRSLLIHYDLQLSTRQESDWSMTPVERFVAARRTGWSALTDADMLTMAQLNSTSPVWHPNNNAFSQVQLIAPEPGTGKNGSDLLPLDLSSEALTLASTFICLFNVEQASLDRMLTHVDDPDQNLFGIKISNLSANATSTEMLDRVARLQFSIIMSAMYATLKEARRTNESTESVAKKWLMLAKPEHVLTRQQDGFMESVEKCEKMTILHYQTPLDHIIEALRQALSILYSHNSSSDERITKEIISIVGSCRTRFEDVLAHSHIKNHSNIEQMDTGAMVTMGFSRLILHMLAPHTLSDYIGFTPRETYEDRREQESIKGTEKFKITQHKVQENIKGYKQLIKKWKELAPIPRPNPEDPYVAAGPQGDDSMHELFRFHYANLAYHLSGPNFTAYLYANEAYTSYMKNDEHLVAYINKLLENFNLAASQAKDHFKRLTMVKDDSLLAGVVNNIETYIKNDLPKNPITPLQMALEWTEQWSHYRMSMAKLQTLFTAKGGKHQEIIQKETDLFVLTCILIKRVNWRAMGTFLKTQLGIQEVQPVSKFRCLLNSKDGGTAELQAGKGPLLIDDSVKQSLISPDTIRDVMMNHISIRDGYFWKWCIDNDMVQALGFLGFRPSMRYEMGTMVMFSGHGETGYTFYSHADMMLSDNAATKMHYGHFTYYSKSIILKSQRIIHGRNVLCRDYNGGNGHKIWDASCEDDRQDYRSGEDNKDIFFVPVLMNHAVDVNHMDITGRYHPDIGAGDELNKSTWYDAAPIYAAYWGWRQGAKLKCDSYVDTRRPRENTVCFQDHQHNYCPGSGKFDRTITNKGHWGERVYPGCGRARRGVDMYLKPVKYDNTAVMGFTV